MGMHHYLVVIAFVVFNPLNTDLNPICHLLALLGAHHILRISRLRVNLMIPLLCTKDWAAFYIPKLQQLVLPALALPVCVTFLLGYKSVPAKVIVQG